MDNEMVKQIEIMIEEGSFRNKSHVLEYALKSFLRGKK